MVIPFSRVRPHHNYDDEQELERRYDILIFGYRRISTTATDFAGALTVWLQGLDPLARFVGFEVELCNDGDNIGTVQFCVGNQCVVFQCGEPENYPPLLLDEFLFDPNNAFVGIDVRSKMAKLKRHFTIEGAVHCIDLGAVVARQFRRPELRQAAQGELTSFILGVEVVMPDVDLTDWGRNTNLTNNQVRYACIEAFLNLEIATRLIRLNEPIYVRELRRLL